LACKLLYYKKRSDDVKIETGGDMKDLTVDELLTRMFRDTANRVGWNVYNKEKRLVRLSKQTKPAETGNLKKLH
jgi:hypothetical protein